MTIFYPDVSSFQTGISFAGCVIAVAKATEGTGYVNPDYGPAKARAASAGAYFCAYHFLLAGNGAGQAQHAFATVGSDVPLMIDCEPEFTHGVISSAPQISDAVDFINEYRSLGGTTFLLYLPHWYWQGNLGSASLAPVSDLGMLLVSSDYTTYSDTGPGWNAYGGMTPVIWQYTSSATLNGVKNVDMNAFKGTVTDFQAAATGGGGGGGGGQSGGPVEPTLSEGATGAAVKTLQTRLNAWGATLTVDGSFGPSTLAAVKAFQTQQQLTADGVVGAQTWAALLADPGTYPAPTGLAVGSVDLSWDAVVVDGQDVDSYTVEAVGLNGQVYVRETPTTNSVTLSGLTAGWTYNILVWANGGPGTPPSASIKVTV